MGQLTEGCREAIMTAIPELAESEDERIRKQLISIMNFLGRDNAIFSEGQITKEQAIAYLEKQKEQEPITDSIKFEEGFKAGREFERREQKEQKPISDMDIVPYIDDKIAELQDMWREQKVAFDWDDMKEMIEGVARHFYRQEQKPAIIKAHKGDDGNPYDMGASEAQEYAIKRGFGIPFNDGEVFVDERYITQTIGNILRWADEHPKEQKPAEWSEEDEKLIRLIISILEDKHPNVFWRSNEMESGVYTEELVDFLKSFCPQPKQGKKGLILTKEQEKEFGHLFTRPSWKPSEEQIAELKALANGKAVFTKDFIVKLYNDLLKLK